MKRMQVLDIIQHEPLKARRRVLVLTGQQKNVEEPVPSSSRPCDAKKSSDLEITTSSYHITVEDIPDEKEEVEADKAPETLEDGGKSTVDELKELNLGTNEDPRPIYVSVLLTKEEEEEYHKLLVEYKDVFAWSYKEIPGLSPKFAVHRLAIKKGTNPKKQSQCRFRSELVPEIEKEVNGLIEACFIREVKYPTWIANIVPVRKKNRQLRICVDFRDLNIACPKDDFPLPVTDLMIDATTSHKALSFMDLLLKKYDLVFVPQKAVKCQAIADFFADHPVPAEWEISDDLPGEAIFYVDVLPPWQMYFDGAARKDGAGARVVFVTPQNHLMPYSFTLTQLCSNNMAEYQALILGLQMAIEIGVRDIDIYGDSKLVVNQVLGEYEVKKEELIPYHQRALQLLNQLDDIHVGHVPRSANKLADALSNLAATLAPGVEESMQVPVCNCWVVSLLEGEENVDTTNMICVYAVNEDDWRQPIIDFLDHHKLPTIPDTRCLSKDEATEAMHEAHSGICGVHQSGPKLHDRVKRMGYYWPTMVQDCMDFAKKCEPCQFYANFIHQPPEPLHPTVSSWPFEAWGLDVVGTLTRKALNGHEVEAMLPLELHIPSLRIAIQEGLTDDENDKLRLAELESLDEKRLEAQQKLQCYQARLSRVFNKKLANSTSKWDGSYVVQEVYTNGAYKIVDEDGVHVGPINGKFLKRYYS
ncbi:uncharacterized protein LOC141617032 [Silene latifolia]|uniref:uncharacterized protein LOC141617032 n=1 Tax=Silene latifolia TaxID=37657 RepID=UPI003D77C98B